jgi:hypothetical protein
MSELLTPVVASVPDTVWKVNAHDMAGDVLIVPCPRNEQTLVSEIKCAIETLKPEYVFERTILAFRLEEQAKEHDDALVAGSSSSVPAIVDASMSVTILQNHQSLIQCGVGNGSALDVFLQDIVWRPRDREYQDKIMAGAKVASFTHSELCDKIDAESAAAVAWTLTVRSKIRNFCDIVYCF